MTMHIYAKCLTNIMNNHDYLNPIKARTQYVNTSVVKLI